MAQSKSPTQPFKNPNLAQPGKEMDKGKVQNLPSDFIPKKGSRSQEHVYSSLSFNLVFFKGY